MSDKLRECCEAWGKTYKQAFSIDTQVGEVVKALAAHLTAHGAIFPSPVEGKSLEQIAHEAYWGKHDHPWDKATTLVKDNWKDAVNAVLAAFAPKVEPAPTVELDGRRQTPFDMLRSLLGDKADAVSRHYADEINNAIFKIVQHFMPKVEPVEVDASVEQMVRDVLEKSLEDGLIAIGEEFEMAVAYPSHFTASDLCGPVNVLSQHLKNCQEQWEASQPQVEPPKYPTVADVISKIPLCGRSYQHKESVYRVIGICQRQCVQGGELIWWVDYQKESNGRIFGCPVAEWIENDYWLVHREGGE